MNTATTQQEETVQKVKANHAKLVITFKRAEFDFLPTAERALLDAQFKLEVRKNLPSGYRVAECLIGNILTNEISRKIELTNEHTDFIGLVIHSNTGANDYSTIYLHGWRLI